MQFDSNYSNLHSSVDFVHSQGAGSNGSFFPVFTWGWLDLLLLACFWLLFGCFCLQDSVSLLLRNAPALFRLLFLLALLLGFCALQQAELHPQLDDGLALLVNRLVQVIVLDLLRKGNKCQGMTVCSSDTAVL